MSLNKNIQIQKFSDTDINDPFFDSLKDSYGEFTDWFRRKAEEKAYVMTDDIGMIQAFLYLKEESGPIEDVTPPLPENRYLKIGTFKINPHGTKLGERFIKKIFDHALHHGIYNIYVTIFPKHNDLIDIMTRYGFEPVAEKETPNGIEGVYLKAIGKAHGDVTLDYPLVDLSNKCYLLSIYPEFHTRLFPDSILNNEDARIIGDVSHTNSIEKIYICRMSDVKELKTGDALVIYRTAEKGKGPAEYTAVATSFCMVEEMKQKSEFSDIDDYLQYCSSRSVFLEEELRSYYRWSQLYVIKMTYNIALTSRIIRKRLIEEVDISRGAYWGFMRLTTEQFKHIAQLGGVNESFIIN